MRNDEVFSVLPVFSFSLPDAYPHTRSTPCRALGLVHQHPATEAQLNGLGRLHSMTYSIPLQHGKSLVDCFCRQIQISTLPECRALGKQHHCAKSLWGKHLVVVRYAAWDRCPLFVPLPFCPPPLPPLSPSLVCPPPIPLCPPPHPVCPPTPLSPHGQN